MEVIIAGYNKTTKGNLNPEIISASYARTSREEKSIPEIREDAKIDIEKARKSNSKIVFEMGHASIAEHTVFNIDIIGVSRFLVEEIESHRLTSYTEKSQRYVLFNGDYVIPKEISLLDGSSLSNFIYTIDKQNNFYKKLYPILLDYFKNLNPDKYKKEPKTVEGWAKEDARYIISMATKTQLGMTINARNLELMIRRLRSCFYSEALELADKLYEKVSKITPSLFPYVEPTAIEKINKLNINNSDKNQPFVSMTRVENNYDEKLSNIIKLTRGYSKELSDEKCILKTLKEMKVYDSAPREFEFIDFEFNLNISSSCYAQLKRHRMMTMIPLNYSDEVIVPKSVKETNMKSEFMDIIEKTNLLASQLNSILKSYVLTNSHCRNVVIKMNLREMYHFCRMRMDSHAQWEIREIANEIHNLASSVCPIGMSLACGKHEFEEVYNKVFKNKN